VHLVGFIIRIYHDARSSECQTKVRSHVLYTHSLMVIKVIGKFHDGTIFLVHQVDTPTQTLLQTNLCYFKLHSEFFSCYVNRAVI